MRRLTKLRIDEVSAVNRGAGKDCEIVLMKRNDNDRPPEGSVREKYEFLIHQLRRGYPDMPVRQARAEAWNALSDDEQIELLREERQMNKALFDGVITDQDLFDAWWGQLNDDEKADYRRRQRLIDDRIADSESVARETSTPDRDVLSRTGREDLSATERAGYGSGRRAKADSILKIAKDFGIERLTKH